ncbi:MAG: amidohydrolase family protein, partial [Deltaproteobacteria bacterium]|nr:amidohydrolase family protein [Deltaproteobacteria bacterium]
MGSSLDWGLSPHAPYTLSSAAINQVFAFADHQNLQCTIHLAESMDETRFLKNGSGAIADRLYAAARWDPTADPVPGCSPVSALCQQGRLRSCDLVVHGVQVDAVDIDLLKKTGCSVALCPRSNAALNVGKAPVSAYLKAGVPLALGTDSLASAPSLSIWDEMAFARDWFA